MNNEHFFYLSLLWLDWIQCKKRTVVFSTYFLFLTPIAVYYSFLKNKQANKQETSWTAHFLSRRQRSCFLSWILTLQCLLVAEPTHHAILYFCFSCRKPTYGDNRMLPLSEENQHLTNLCVAPLHLSLKALNCIPCSKWTFPIIFFNLNGNSHAVVIDSEYKTDCFMLMCKKQGCFNITIKLLSRLFFFPFLFDSFYLSQFWYNSKP